MEVRKQLAALGCVARAENHYALNKKPSLGSVASQPQAWPRLMADAAAEPTAAF